MSSKQQLHELEERIGKYTAKIKKLEQIKTELQQQINEEERDLLTEKDLPEIGHFQSEFDALYAWARKNGYTGDSTDLPLSRWLYGDQSRKDRWSRVLAAHRHLIKPLGKSKRGSRTYTDISQWIVTWCKNNGFNSYIWSERHWLGRDRTRIRKLLQDLEEHKHEFDPRDYKSVKECLILDATGR
jgi:hypothetical protein